MNTKERETARIVELGRMVKAMQLALDRFDESERRGMPHSGGVAWWACAWAMAGDLRRALCAAGIACKPRKEGE